MKVFSYRNLRITILLALLAFAAIYTQEQKLTTTSWYKPIPVSIFPINGDDTTETADYIAQLSIEDFQDIDTFFKTSAQDFKLIVEQPIVTHLGGEIESYPPAPPKNGASVLSIMLWSIKLRYWAYKNTPDDLSNSNRIRLYVLYHQANGQSLQHSLGLQKGLIGVIHAFADTKQNSQNAVVMAHEIFHTVGATDKYDQHNQPYYPDGYAQPDKSPLHPQRFAEIMAGRMALSEHEAIMPNSLKQVRVGSSTAKEINWISEH